MRRPSNAGMNKSGERGAFASGQAFTGFAAATAPGSDAQDDLGLLRRKLADLARVRDALINRCKKRIQVVDEQMENLRGANGFDRKRVSEAGHNLPSVRLLASPLVVRSESGEYLGVQGGNGHFALKDFIELMRKGASTGKNIDLNWQRNRKNWVLLVTATDVLTGQARRIFLVVRRFVTPAGNTVALIVRFAIDGCDATNEALLDLLRKIRAGYGTAS